MNTTTVAVAFAICCLLAEAYTLGKLYQARWQASLYKHLSDSRWTIIKILRGQ